MAFCWIPPGECQLGSPLAEQKAVLAQYPDIKDWIAGESEAKRGVYTSKGFWLAKYPVTQAEWYALTGETPSCFRIGGLGANEVKGLDTTRFPVEQVSWDMICGKGGFLEKLNALSGAEKVFGRAVTFALPHEDAWEYACRGGKSNQQPFYFGTEFNGTQANIDRNDPFGTTKNGPRLEQRPAYQVGSYRRPSSHTRGACSTCMAMSANGAKIFTNKHIFCAGPARTLPGHTTGSSAAAVVPRRALPQLDQNRCIGFRVFVPGL